MAFGITGKIMRVDLTTGAIRVENKDEIYYRTYFGGRALIADYLLRETGAETEALSKENKIIIAAGPLTGSNVPGAGRNSVGAISPLTGGFGDAEVGGYFGSELKKAGYDAVIVEGKSNRPVYIAIKDNSVELRNADHIWGKTTAEAQSIIKQEMNDQRARVCQIGPAGEKMIPYACVVNDLTHFAGRTGMGAVFGYKNLRAIAVKSSGKTETAEPEKVKELARWLNVNYMKLSGALHNEGTASVLMPLNHAGGLPTKNFNGGVFEGAERISGLTMTETILIGKESCFACPIRCKRVVEAQNSYQVNPVYGGPEYETIAAFGSLCGVDDLEAVAKGNEICNAHGIDTISTGVSIAFAMECFKNGIIGKGDTGGLELNFGNKDAMLELIENIVVKNGLGELLSKGVKKAAEIIGNGAEKYAMHIKGQEIPMHEPRIKSGLGLGYAVSPTGADHCHNLHDTAFTNSIKALAPFGILEPLEADRLDPKKVRMFTYFSNWRHFGNCAIYCLFVPWSANQIVDITRAVTGWDTSLWEMMKVGERAATLSRIINIRKGFGRKDDCLNKRFFSNYAEGPDGDFALQKESFESALSLYYAIMGWDELGIPTKAKLHELNLGWAEQFLP